MNLADTYTRLDPNSCSIKDRQKRFSAVKEDWIALKIINKINNGKLAIICTMADICDTQILLSGTKINAN